MHCVKSVQIQLVSGPYFSCIRSGYGDLISVFSPDTRKYGPAKTPYLDTFHAAGVLDTFHTVGVLDTFHAAGVLDTFHAVGVWSYHSA